METKLLYIKEYLFKYYHKLKSQLKGEDMKASSINSEQTVSNMQISTILNYITETTNLLIKSCS